MKLQRLKGLAVTAVMTTALGTAMLVTVPQSYGDDHAKCQRQIERAESKLDEAIRKRRSQPIGPASDKHDLAIQVQIHWTILAQPL